MFSESAELYDAIYGAFKDYAREADAIAAVIRANHPAAERLLDVGCGTGEHVKHLRARGFVADGLDIDPQLLAVARRKVPNAGFFEADMSDFELSHRYDVVACLFSSIGYLRTMPRVIAALHRFRRHLAPNGIVVVEPWFAPGVLHVGKGSTRHGDRGGTRVERTSHVSVHERLSTLVFEYEIQSPAGVRRRAKFTSSVSSHPRRCWPVFARRVSRLRTTPLASSTIGGSMSHTSPPNDRRRPRPGWQAL